jgi:hypothetical protein
MFTSNAPPSIGRSAGALRVAGAHRLVYQQPSATADDPRLAEFLTDMLGPYQVEFRGESLGLGQSYAEMGEPLIDALTSPERPIDLLVLAFSVHDLRPGQATAPYLSHRCPGSPMAFSVCDQGVAAGFIGLRLIQTYVRTGRFDRALLLVMEQTALHYQPARPAPLPDRTAAVALLLERTGSAALTPVRQYPSVPPELAGRRLADQVAALATGRPAVTLVAGAEYADDLLSDRRLPDLVEQILIAPAGQPATGAWSEFAGGIAEWTDQPRLVLVADYDRPLGYLSLGAADFAEDVPAEPALLASTGRQVST